jgi:hypothetical protein
MEIGTYVRGLVDGMSEAVEVIYSEFFLIFYSLFFWFLRK